MIATLMEGEHGDKAVTGKAMLGQNSSSLNRLKDINNKGTLEISLCKAGTDMCPQTGASSFSVTSPSEDKESIGSDSTCSIPTCEY